MRGFNLRLNKNLTIALFFLIYFLTTFFPGGAAFAVAPPLDVQKAVPPDLLPANPRGYGAMISPAAGAGRSVFYSMGDGAGVNLVEYLKTNNNVSIIVIAVEFSDVKMTPSGFAGINSMLGEMCRFFSQQSNQKLNLTAYPSPRVYKLNNTMGRYGNSDDAEALVRDAVAACDAEVDFSKYQCVMVAHAGYGDETNPSDYGTSDIWSKYWYSSGYSVSTADGVSVSGATIVPELEYEGVSPLGVICHEFGHQLGLPDLYDTSYSTEGGIGRWSLMATGAYNGVPRGSRPAFLDPWCRKRLGWIEYEKLTGDYRDFNFESGRVYQIVADAAGSEQDYFLLEKRFKDPAGYDAGLPSEGLLIYHVNAVRERENSLSPNNYSPGLIWLMCANGKDHLTVSPRSKIRGLETDPYPSGDSRDFYFYSLPSSKTWGGIDSGVAVRNIRKTSGGASMIVTADIYSGARAEKFFAAALFLAPGLANRAVLIVKPRSGVTDGVTAVFNGDASAAGTQKLIKSSDGRYYYLIFGVPAGAGRVSATLSGSRAGEAVNVSEENIFYY